MAYGVRLEVWGDYACFTRPELKVERFSYLVMTPSAARGILEAIFWHGGLRWIVDRIHVLSEIQFENIRRNERKSKILCTQAASRAQKGTLYQVREGDLQQRASTVLRQPHYVISAHFEMTEKANLSDNPGKFREMFCRRAKKGQCYHTPYFGCREFPARFRLYEEEEVRTAHIGETKDLGFMLYDMDYSDPRKPQPMFFRAQLVDGVLDLRDCEVYR
ncbi:type I-C CRISPR-associated protein Cas5c [uncultured Selenomonas sp.]|jgi:CRISPR-associated protein cas5, dvulg subtype|uniref:type I-C CRISPR-associated protein Cas5c n=1 Tax=uncultured Selenomonas sp. TaxID=159275 RepID=UPI0028DD1B81|nr:type I-C CRISPR-associated protein Cas5c [uncultured Selenomonas sp.]